jgi:hypothetical protein
MDIGSSHWSIILDPHFKTGHWESICFPGFCARAIAICALDVGPGDPPTIDASSCLLQNGSFRRHSMFRETSQLIDLLTYFSCIPWISKISHGISPVFGRRLEDLTHPLKISSSHLRWTEAGSSVEKRNPWRPRSKRHLAAIGNRHWKTWANHREMKVLLGNIGWA